MDSAGAPRTEQLPSHLRAEFRSAEERLFQVLHKRCARTAPGDALPSLPRYPPTRLLNAAADWPCMSWTEELLADKVVGEHVVSRVHTDGSRRALGKMTLRRMLQHSHASGLYLVNAGIGSALPWFERPAGSAPGASAGTGDSAWPTRDLGRWPGWQPQPQPQPQPSACIKSCSTRRRA